MVPTRSPGQWSDRFHIERPAMTSAVVPYRTSVALRSSRQPVVVKRSVISWSGQVPRSNTNRNRCVWRSNPDTNERSAKRRRSRRRSWPVSTPTTGTVNSTIISSSPGFTPAAAARCSIHLMTHASQLDASIASPHGWATPDSMTGSERLTLPSDDVAISRRSTADRKLGWRAGMRGTQPQRAWTPHWQPVPDQRSTAQCVIRCGLAQDQP